jgi:hypothetical protein
MGKEAVKPQRAGQPGFFSAVAALFFFRFPFGRVLPVLP